MQINALKTFLTIVQTGSFHAAAGELNITQTAVSARIKSLEAGVEAKLFERGPGGTRLSSAGRQFRPYAEQMLRTWDLVRADLSGAMRGRVSLRLGSQLSIWDPLLVDVAVWLEQDQGKVPFVINYDHALNMGQAVEQQLLDIAIVNETPPGTRLGVEEFPPETLYLVADRPVDLRVGDLPLFINLEFGPEYDAQLQVVLPGRSQQHIVLGNALMGLRYLLKRGGMGFFPETMIDEHLASGRLHKVTGAERMSLSCKALYLTENPNLTSIQEVMRGLRQIRPAKGNGSRI
ncbi:LysR family transcriptional regulator [Aliisedimentitalea scapharcae]|uniref:LysR family transcriptional regulator n=1 Tax=Aliisedimentitalea scapharcae TaxID=1524259 RepID=A0ABZ2Y1T0_9RHOB